MTCSHGVVVFSLPLLSTSEPIDFISFVTIYILVHEIIDIKLIACHIIVCCANFLAQENDLLVGGCEFWSINEGLVLGELSMKTWFFLELEIFLP